MAGQKVTISAVVVDSDGKSEFASLKLEYNNVPRAGVLAIEQELIDMQSRLLDIAKGVEEGSAVT